MWGFLAARPFSFIIFRDAADDSGRAACRRPLLASGRIEAVRKPTGVRVDGVGQLCRITFGVDESLDT
jgi:hypothetical protein